MVSVLMSVYKEPLSYIRYSVDSILNQSYKDIEFIIIVDNPSNMDLITLLKEYEKKERCIKLFINEKNLGLTGSLNKALNYAQGEFIARMDADDISMPKRIEKQLEYLTHNQLDLIGSNIQDINENGNICSDVTIYPETNEQIIRYARYNSPIPHPTWFGKKSVFDKLNGYQEVEACEDYDFLVRAILDGFKLGNIQEPLLKYRINLKGISSTKKAKQKTALYFIRKNYRRGVSVSEKKYEEFISSAKGERKLADLNDYYKKTSKLKELPKNSLKSLLYEVYIFLSSREGRLLTTNLLKERFWR
ncbi:MAG: glycosyltransferase [Dorea sp.]|jgi:glycosyltransferase involved in cell wall biosynthesis|nr:glycosyltransferase [Dorea sp.]